MKSTTKNLIKILIVLLLSAGAFLLPFEAMGLALNNVQIAVVALFVMAALLWILEPIPIWTTSVLVIAICLLFLSNKAFNFVKPEVYNKKAVTELVATGLNKPAADPQVKELAGQICKRLDTKTGLDAHEIYTSAEYVLLKAHEKAMAPYVKAIKQLKDKPITGMQPEAIIQGLLPEASQEEISAAIARVQQRLAEKQTTAPEEVRTSVEYVLLDMSENSASVKALGDSITYLHSGEALKHVKKIKITNVMAYKGVMSTFADPVIILFLGGFFLAAAATKFRLDMNLANVLLKPFGKNPRYVLLGLMAVTALFSAFMSNTATAAMMLAILTPVLALFPQGDGGRTAFALSIPIACNLGGIATPIGTPPNAIAVKALGDIGMSVSFGKWMCFGFPFVALMLVVAWLLLCKMFPTKKESLELKVGGAFDKSPKAIVVYCTFAVTIALWVLSDPLGLDSNAIAIIPIAVFAVTGVITAKDLREMSWDVLWLVAGGFALGLALQQTNLAKDLINAIPFGNWNAMMLMIGAGLICLFLSTFISNSATAALLMPIMGAVASAMMAQNVITGGFAVGLCVCCAMGCALAMALPISTPPNALAYATGMVENKSMAIVGAILGVAGLAIAVAMMYLLDLINFF